MSVFIFLIKVGTVSVWRCLLYIKSHYYFIACCKQQCMWTHFSPFNRVKHENIQFYLVPFVLEKIFNSAANYTSSAWHSVYYYCARNSENDFLDRKLASIGQEACIVLKLCYCHRNALIVALLPNAHLKHCRAGVKWGLTVKGLWKSIFQAGLSDKKRMF